MKIVLACDSFKNSLTAFEVVEIIEKAIIEVLPQSEIIKVPLADGGENTLDVLEYFFDTNKINVLSINERNHDLHTYFIKINDKAYIESAKVIGIKRNPKNILDKNSYGIGALIKEALLLDVKEIYLTLGGSSTNDGGIGLLAALNTKFYNKDKIEIFPTLYNIKEIYSIDPSDTIKLLEKSKLIVLSDVLNPFNGHTGASKVFAKQKGASKEEVQYLEEALTHLNNIYIRDFNIDLSKVVGSGAAGGISGSLHALLNVEIRSGINEILELINFDSIIKDADLVICGEGKIDKQSTYNKVIYGVAQATKKYNIKTIAIGGSLELENKELQQLNIDAAFSTINKIITLDDALDNAKDNLYETTLNVINLIK